MKAKTGWTATTTGPAKRNEKELAKVRAALLKLRAKLMAEPMDLPGDMDHALLDVESAVFSLADQIDAGVLR